MRIRAGNWFRLLLYVFSFCIVAAAFYAAHIYRTYPLPSKEYILSRRDFGITLLDRNKTEFYNFNRNGAKNPLSLDEVPLHVQQAFIAAEDQGFYHHYGVSPTGIIRAAVLNLKQDKVIYGGSTITQQVIKNTYFSPEKSLQRKVDEAIIAVKLENRFTKEEILEMYLNSIYLGRGAIGIEAGAQRYFGIPAKDLTASQAASLAAMLPAPSELAPERSPDELAVRHRSILARMNENNFLSIKQARAAASNKLTFIPQTEHVDTVAAHFALLIRDKIFELYGEEAAIRQGLTVTTTLDLSQQEKAAATLKSHMQTVQSYGASNGSVVVIDPHTSQVHALIGSVDWNTPEYGKINMAVSPRQTGSAFKPIVYAAGIESKKITASSILNDSPTTYGKDYRPQNYDGSYRGRVSARFALGNSLNIPAVDTVSQIGPALVAHTAKEFGISTLSAGAPYNLSIALGAENISLLELTNAYAAFANQGTYQTPRYILDITDKYDRPVPLPERVKRQVVSPATAYIISSILSDNPTRQQTFGNTLKLDRPAAAKTGTTQNFRDAWTVGYTPSLAVGVWIGNSDNTPMPGLPGANGAAPLWKNVMEDFLDGTPTEEFDQPTGIVPTQICRGSGLKARTTSGSYEENKTSSSNSYIYTEYFLVGTAPTRYCPPPRQEPSPDENVEKIDDQTNPGPQSPTLTTGDEVAAGRDT